MKKTEVFEVESLEALLDKGGDLRQVVVQGLDLKGYAKRLLEADLEGAVFLGCVFDSSVSEEALRAEGAVLFPRFHGLPYQAYRPFLYSRAELMEGWSAEKDESVDMRIYEHFVDQGRVQADVMEALAQRTHDHAIDNALGDLLSGRLDVLKGKASEAIPKKVVAVMGGHGMLRSDPYFTKVAKVARELSLKGYFLASGGGPGVMEATNFGAYFSAYSEEEMMNALSMLQVAPHYADEGFVGSAMEVIEAFPEGAESLAIPTWFYGHEPSNAFSTYIAKYFSNSLREDGLLAIAKHGVIYAPGSAGTVQEVFMDAAQNHYETYGAVSPMVFLGRERYGKSSRIFEALQSLAGDLSYAKYLALFEEVEEVVRFVVDHPPLYKK